jgi:rhodanese-related sulfurtransferase
MLLADAGYGKVYHLEKGIRGWSAENKPLSSRLENPSPR